MAEITSDQQRPAAAARSAGVKIQAFHEGLTSDEQAAIDLALRQIDAAAGGSADDAAGYSAATSMMLAAAVRMLAGLQIGTAPYMPPPLRDAP